MTHLISMRALAAGVMACASVLAACTDDVAEVTATSAAAETSADPKGRPITDEEIARIVSQPGFAENRETIAEQGGEIELASGLVYTYADGVSGNEARFAVSTSDDAASLDDLVFQQGARESFFYFVAQVAAEEAKPAGARPGGAETSGLFGCGGWSSWALTGTYCGNHFWCFGKAQRGTYSTWTRSRQCRNGIQVANRTNFVGCGC